MLQLHPLPLSLARSSPSRDSRWVLLQDTELSCIHVLVALAPWTRLSLSLSLPLPTHSSSSRHHHVNLPPSTTITTHHPTHLIKPHHHNHHHSSSSNDPHLNLSPPQPPNSLSRPPRASPTSPSPPFPSIQTRPLHFRFNISQTAGRRLVSHRLHRSCPLRFDCKR